MYLRTAINQAPGGGSLYPFTVDTALATLVLDLYLAYDDAACELVLPFQLQRLTGLGTGDGPTDSESASLANTYDILITDANGATVFDSTTTTVATIAWGDNRRVIEWIDSQRIVRIVACTVGEVTDTFAPIIDTDDAVLDPRTCHRIPAHVSAIRVGTVVLQGGVQIRTGYNVSLVADAAPTTLQVNAVGDLTTGGSDGGAFVTALEIDGVPGAGLGRVEGCDSPDTPIRTINQIQPDAAGNFTIEADDCFRLQLPVRVTEDDAGFRTAEYAATGYSEEQVRTALALYDDCTPCCDCHFFARTYLGLSREWNQWATLATEAERIRDVYSDNRDRWLAQLECRLSAPIKLLVAAEANCRAFAGATYCNLSKACLRNVEARYTIQLFRGGAPVADIDLKVKEATIEASGMSTAESYSPNLTTTAVQFFADFVNPQETYSTKLRVCYDCEPGDVVEVTLTIHAADPVAPPELAEPGVLPVVEVPSSLLLAWSDAGLDPGDTVRAIMTKVSVTPASGSPEFDCIC